MNFRRRSPLEQRPGLTSFQGYRFTLKRTSMNQKSPKARRPSAEPKPFDQARDELFQHIMQCEVAGSHPDHRKEWFDETLAYMAGRYHELTVTELAELRTLGERFAQPAKTAQAISA